MKVECSIDPSLQEPCATLYIREMTPAIAEIIRLLESTASVTGALAAERDGKTYFIEQDSLELIRTEGREIACYDRAKHRYTLARPLYELESILGSSFIRVSKSTIVNMRRISHVAAAFNGTMELTMKCGVQDYISRSFRKAFKERLGL